MQAENQNNGAPNDDELSEAELDAATGGAISIGTIKSNTSTIGSGGTTSTSGNSGNNTIGGEVSGSGPSLNPKPK